MERNEMARISNRCEMAEQKLSMQMANSVTASEETARAQTLQSMLDECEKQRRLIADQYEEEHK